MNNHFRILQERVEAVAIHAGKRLKHAAGVHRGESLERTLDKVVQREEEGLDAGENHANVRHELAIFVAVGDKNRDDVDGEQEAPEEQRAFLARPERGNFIECGEIAIAVGYDVSLGKIIGEEEILKAERGDEDQNAGGHAGLARALHQQRVAGDDRGDAAN